LEDLCVLVPLLKSSAQIPVSVSYKPNSLDDIGRLLSAGVDRLGIAIDAVEPNIYSEVKGGSFSSAKEYLVAAASRYPGKISTHVIVGLGESEESVLRIVSESIECGITVALFAFTPVRGTPMESKIQPDIGSYRRIQAACHLLRLGLVSVSDIRFEEGRIKSIEIEPERAIRALQSGTAFQTSGCDGCNRPFYNERPGSVMYNYPRPLRAHEVEEAIAGTGLWKQR
jgi:biotin synthase